MLHNYWVLRKQLPFCVCAVFMSHVTECVPSFWYSLTLWFGFLQNFTWQIHQHGYAPAGTFVTFAVLEQKYCQLVTAGDS